jgi:hypothetical protein
MVELLDNGNLIGFCSVGSRGERRGETEHQHKAEDKRQHFFHGVFLPIIIVCVPVGVRVTIVLSRVPL